MNVTPAERTVAASKVLPATGSPAECASIGRQSCGTPDSVYHTPRELSASPASATPPITPEQCQGKTSDVARCALVSHEVLTLRRGASVPFVGCRSGESRPAQKPQTVWKKSLAQEPGQATARPSGQSSPHRARCQRRPTLARKSFYSTLRHRCSPSAVSGCERYSGT